MILMFCLESLSEDFLREQTEALFDTQAVAIAPKATPLLVNAMEWRLCFNVTHK